MKREEWMEYLEPEEADLKEAEALLWENAVDKDRRRTRFSKKRWIVLLAACMLVAACGIVAAAGGGKKNGWLSSYFNVSNGREQELLWQMDAEAEAVAEDAGYRIEVTESVSDGNSIYALLTVTAPKGAGFDERQYRLDGSPWEKVEEGLGGTSFLAGGGYIEDVGRPAKDQAAFLFVWDVNDEIKGRKVVLKITEIAVYTGDGLTEEVVAEGEWELMLSIPEIETKDVRQWTKVETGAETYYVHEVTFTPLGIHIHAVKAVPVSLLWESAEYAVKKYVFRQNTLFPNGWQKEAFYELPVTVVYQDGSEDVIRMQNNSSRGFSCEKSVSFETKKLVDPAEIQELRLGDTLLRCR